VYVPVFCKNLQWWGRIHQQSGSGKIENFTMATHYVELILIFYSDGDK
jgi:hypothetical protein